MEVVGVLIIGVVANPPTLLLVVVLLILLLVVVVLLPCCFFHSLWLLAMCQHLTWCSLEGS